MTGTSFKIVQNLKRKVAPTASMYRLWDTLVDAKRFEMMNLMKRFFVDGKRSDFHSVAPPDGHDSLWV